MNDKPAVPSSFGRGVRNRESFRRTCNAQNAILSDMVLYAPPGMELDLTRLLEEHNRPIVSAAREYRAWLAAHPEAHILNPAATDAPDLVG